ncbi:MAG: hypothetical protein VX583_09585 [Bdellovibrionota bacterium]
MLKPVDLEKVKDLASRYVSAHNTQPAKWFIKGKEFLLTDDESRKLPFADPNSHDHLVSIGAALETMKIALSGFGFGLKVLSQSLRPCVEIRCELVEVSETDPLFPFLENRRSVRNKFRKANCSEKSALKSQFLNKANIKLVEDKKTITEVANDFNRANYHFLGQKDYLAELNEWLRFDRSDSSFTEDGLNPEAMYLSQVEAFGAKYVLKPSIFSILKKMGLAKTMIDEKSKVLSATAIAFLVVKEETDEISRGSFFMRTWLEFTQIGFSLNPLSCLTDFTFYNEKWSKRLHLNSDEYLLNAFRVGPTPEKLASNFRLPKEKVFLEKEI